MNEVLDIRKKEQLMQAFYSVEQIVSKNYLHNLQDYQIKQISRELADKKVSSMTRLVKLEKYVVNKKENNLEKIGMVYSALSGGNSSLVYIIDSKDNQVDLYLGVVNYEGDIGSLAASKKILLNSLKGQFPGTELNENLYDTQVEQLVTDIFSSNDYQSTKSIVSVSGIGALKEEEKDTNFLQGIDQFIDSMQGENYTAILIANPLNHHHVNTIKDGYWKIYSQLTPFLKSEMTIGKNDSFTITDGTSDSFSDSINESLANTQNYTTGKSESKSYTTNSSLSKVENPVLATLAAGAGAALAFGLTGGASAVLGLSEIGGIASGAGLGFGAVTALGGMRSDGESTTTSTSTNFSESSGMTKSYGTTTTKTASTSHSKSTLEGNSQTLGITYENRAVKSLLETIDKQLERLEKCEDRGMWAVATYIISDNTQVGKVAANNYKALMQGENSSLEAVSINTWDNRDPYRLELVRDYLKKLSHPIFESEMLPNGLKLSPASIVSSLELAIKAGLPRKSIAGLPVVESCAFGRNIYTMKQSNDSRDIQLGEIYHMGRSEQIPVNLALDSLTMHTFITGSTGSGKSNTIYRILDEANKKGIKFLVIEPAKGEYRQVFGGRSDVSVYGTNIKYSKLLKINPFKFPEDIHVLEHIDRLIEIFNACWPMYAAMPAVLKEAIEMAYEMKGWDLNYSLNIEDESSYPTFKDLLDTLKIVIEQSGYSEELKSNYTGALVTRVKSLTNGLLGQIFTEDSLEDKLLFDENVIVDLSRVSSVETKSLITGMLFIKLQEYRMCHAELANSKLKHLTVLEEAHNLLKRCSSQQSQEGANLQGKSVEMISNSIAEMRTYGEGFIIADQAPNLLDDSVIRNTNTKIILRLPQYEDRQSVGKAASLTDDQINEIPKLETGVAVVYQNNWLEPILCKVDEFNNFNPLKYEFDLADYLKINSQNQSDLLSLLMNSRVRKGISLKEERLNELLEWLPNSTLSIKQKQLLQKNLVAYKLNQHMQLWEQESFEKVCQVVEEIIDKNKMTTFAMKANDFKNWTEFCQQFIRTRLQLPNEEIEYSIIQCLLSSKAKEDTNFETFYFKWVEMIKNKGESIA